MRHLDLFSGIGGFALAAQTVWQDEYECIGFCDNDYFCQQVLTKNFPGVPIYDDIRTLTNTRCKRRDEGCGKEIQPPSKKSEWSNTNDIDLITGGFPCQPFSAAGKRKGTADDRHLWPEMFRVIREFKPTWVIAENVKGLLTWSEGLVFEQVCTDLESQGYEVEAFNIPACGVNAPHRRERVWIVANCNNSGSRTPDNGIKQKWSESNKRQAGQPLRRPSRSSQDWTRNWREVAFTTCNDRMDDGISSRMVRLPDGTTISKARWRKEALKAYGNAIVPQVAMEIMRAISLTQ